MASITPYGLRMPRELKGTLDTAARRNGRSLNSEIVARLEASVQVGEGVPGFVTPDFAAQVKVLAQELETLQARVRALEIRTNAHGCLSDAAP
jgi:hypothetical protein